MSDRGYFHLLTHLARTNTSLPLQTAQASIAHYLAHAQPSPAQLAGSVASSPFFRPISYSKLDALQTAFRHAVHVKVKLLQDDKGGLFTRSLAARTGEWIGEVLKGLEGGEGPLRLACTSGLLLGLTDWEQELLSRTHRAKHRVGDEMILALAEVMDLHRNSSSGWEREFKSDTQDLLDGALLVTARALPLIESRRLSVLPLADLTQLLLNTINSAFKSGTFLSTLPDSTASRQDGVFQLQPGSQFEREVQRVSASPVLQSMASLSALLVQVLSALADTRPEDAWGVMTEIMQRLDTLTAAVESDWLKSPLASVLSSEDVSIAPESREIAATVWTVLKTLLFTAIRLVQAVLSVVVFVPAPPSPANAAVPASPMTHEPIAFSLSLTALHVFSHLAFVLPQFGGVASTGEDSFPELKKAFYTALDVLSSDPAESARFVHELHGAFLHAAVERAPWPVQFAAAKKAYTLACIEQLVPVLGEISIRYDVYPLCAPHLDDSSHRETFESAHSVVLAIFVAHAQKASEQRGRRGKEARDELPFAEEFIPAYVQCLLNNSADGKLNTQQLCLAFRALVRSAGAFGGGGDDDGAPAADVSAANKMLSEGDAFAWYCVDTFLRCVQGLGSERFLKDTTENEDQLHRLRLALVASVSSVSLTLLPRLLEAMRDVVNAMPTGERRRELVEALFQEIAVRVGDEEKEFAMRWWYEHRVGLLGTDASDDSGDADAGKGKGKERAKELVARL